ncbi:MAG: peptidyl-prolyl cis-trans isomerase [Armatimonadetes bacterium]|nr:peptidyl-prolyl cis-trans isomerase [Armatimonadota bacterium]
MNRIAVGALTVALLASLAANALLYTRYSASRPLLTMGDTVVTRKDYRDALDTQHGKTVLRKLVLSRLVEREARKAGVLPTTVQVDERLKKLESTAPAVVRAAQADAARLYTLRTDVFNDLALDALRMREVSVSDAQVADYYAKNRAQFVRPMQVDTTAVMTATESDAATAATLLKQDMKPHIIARQPRMNVVGIRGFQPDFSKLAPADATRLEGAMRNTKPGQVTTVLLQGNFLVFRVRRQQGTQVLTLAAARDEVKRQATLAQAPSQQEYLVRLYQESHPVFEANQYAEYFREFEEARVAPAKPVATRQTASR